MKKAPVNKIIPFSNVDGPGNRTSIFFQGCTFNCRFCHNPETISLCRNCGACVSGCPGGALQVTGGMVVWEAEKCLQCDRCIRVCPHLASPKVRWMTVEQVFHEVKRSAPYISGITVSGGECTMRNAFLTDLFHEVRQIGKTCLMDSNGSFDFEQDPRVLEDAEGVMLDVKAADPAWHRTLTGASETMVVKNLHYLLRTGKLFEVRTVVFPGLPEKNEQTVRFVSSVIGSACPYKIIRYRPYGVREAYQAELGMETTDEAEAERLAGLARSLGASKAFVV